MGDDIHAAIRGMEFQPHRTALSVAYVLALPIGWDREREERSAGIRTFPLVAIAACGFVQAAETILQGSPDAIARVIEGIAAGIGFIGGGAAGLGAFDIVVLLSLVTFLTLKVLTPPKPESHGASLADSRK